MCWNKGFLSKKSSYTCSYSLKIPNWLVNFVRSVCLGVSFFRSALFCEIFSYFPHVVRGFNLFLADCEWGGVHTGLVDSLFVAASIVWQLVLYLSFAVWLYYAVYDLVIILCM